MVIKYLDFNIKAWNAIFAISLALLILSVLNAFTEGLNLITFTIQALFTLSLFGLSREKEIWHPKIWRGLFYIYIAPFSIFVLITIYFLLFRTDGKTLVYTASELVIAILLFLFHVMQLRGLYLYAFKAREVWYYFRHGFNNG